VPFDPAQSSAHQRKKRTDHRDVRTHVSCGGPRLSRKRDESIRLGWQQSTRRDQIVDGN
jgi:hypothetical protein